MMLGVRASPLPTCYQEYEADKKKRLGEDGAKPKRIRYKRLAGNDEGVTVQRYPENTTATIDHFRNSSWKGIINSSDREGYPSMWQALSAAAQVAIEAGNNAEGKALWLLADACSMILHPSSTSEPFRPYMVMHSAGRRSVLPEDFQQSDVTLLAQFSEEIDDIWLQARLADLAWLLISPRRAQ